MAAGGVTGLYAAGTILPHAAAKLNQPHDLLFRALYDDPRRAGVLIRDYLPEWIASRLSDEPPVLLDGSFVDPRLSGSQSDRLFSVALRGGGTILIYVLMEHKSTPDPETPLQLQDYRTGIWRRYANGSAARLRKLPPIIPLVFYHGRQAWEVPATLTDCLDADEELREYLRDQPYFLCNLGPVPDRELASDAEVRAALLSLKYSHREIDPETLLEAVLRELPDGAYLEPHVICYILATQPLITVDVLTMVVRRAKPHREKVMLSLAAKEWMKQGRAEGWQEGRAEGEADRAAKSILTVLSTRFGQLPPHVEPWVRQLTTEQLDKLLPRAVTAPSIDEFMAAERSH
jgi:predicted transposase YdaD